MKWDDALARVGIKAAGKPALSVTAVLGGVQLGIASQYSVIDPVLWAGWTVSFGLFAAAAKFRNGGMAGVEGAQVPPLLAKRAHGFTLDDAIELHDALDERGRQKYLRYSGPLHSMTFSLPQFSFLAASILVGPFRPARLNGRGLTRALALPALFALVNMTQDFFVWRLMAALGEGRPDKGASYVVPGSLATSSKFAVSLACLVASPVIHCAELVNKTLFMWKVKRNQA